MQKLILTLFCLLPSLVYGVDLQGVIALHRDQHQNEALELYLELLQEQPVDNRYQASERELELYDEAMSELCNSMEREGAKRVAQEILLRYSPEMVEHPGDKLLNTLIATAYFVLDDAENFYPSFLLSYQGLADHYHSHKLQGLMWQKLAGAHYGPKRRDCEGKAAHSFQKAVEKKPDDTQLYAAIVKLASDTKKKTLALWCLNALHSHQHALPRRDLGFWAQQALDCGDENLAERFFEQAQGWYDYSRQLNAAQAKFKKLRRQKKA